jgi:hypothetical protein
MAGEATAGAASARPSGTPSFGVSRRREPEENRRAEFDRNFRIAARRARR